jgi:hypothetical protein
LRWRGRGDPAAWQFAPLLVRALRGGAGDGGARPGVEAEASGLKSEALAAAAATRRPWWRRAAFACCHLYGGWNWFGRAFFPKDVAREDALWLRLAAELHAAAGEDAAALAALRQAAVTRGCTAFEGSALLVELLGRAPGHVAAELTALQRQRNGEDTRKRQQAVDCRWRVVGLGLVVACMVVWYALAKVLGRSSGLAACAYAVDYPQ